MSTFLKLYNREKHATFFRIAEHHRVGGYREKESTLGYYISNREKLTTFDVADLCNTHYIDKEAAHYLYWIYVCLKEL